MPDVIGSRHGTTMVLRLNRPQRHNAIGGALFGELIESAEAADGDTGIRAIVTIGQGGAYCVGADLGTLRGLGERGRIDLGELGTDGVGGRTGLPVGSDEQRRADQMGIGRWAARFLEIGTPTVAAINGAAAGGGFALTMLHDVRVMARSARLAPGFAALGLAPEMGLTWLLPRLVGSSTAFTVLTRKKPIEADEALELGLVDQVVEYAELHDAALAVAAGFGDVTDRSVRAIKRLLRQSAETTLTEQLEREWVAQRLLFADERTPEVIAELDKRRRRPRDT